MTAFRQQKQIVLKIDYHNEQDVIRFLHEFKKEFITVHELKRHFDGVYVEIQNQQFFELSFKNPEPRKDRINGIDVLIYPSRMNDD